MAKEPCLSCGATVWHTMNFVYPKNKSDAIVTCSECTHLPLSPRYDDVYIGSGGGIKTDENLCDPKTGREIPFHTKQDKAVVMKMLGLRQAESAERQHGSRNEMFLHRKKYFV